MPITFHPPDYDPFAHTGPDVDISLKSTRYPPLPLEVRDGIEVRTYAAGYPGQRIGVGPRAVRRFGARRIVNGVVVQGSDGHKTLAAAESAADMMAAGLHGTCRECKGPCDESDRFDPSDERPTCSECIAWIYANVRAP